MTARLLAILLLAALPAIPKDKKPGGKNKEESKPAQAVLLDHAEYLCKNCFLGNSDYYFCFDVNSKIMIGHEKIRVQTRRVLPDNLLGERGKTVPIRYDDEYIWITGPNGKDQRLTQDYTKKLFMFNDSCQKAAK